MTAIPVFGKTKGDDRGGGCRQEDRVERRGKAFHDLSADGIGQRLDCLGIERPAGAGRHGIAMPGGEARGKDRTEHRHADRSTDLTEQRVAGGRDAHEIARDGVLRRGLVAVAVALLARAR